MISWTKCLVPSKYSVSESCIHCCSESSSICAHIQTSCLVVLMTYSIHSIQGHALCLRPGSHTLLSSGALLQCAFLLIYSASGISFWIVPIGIQTSWYFYHLTNKSLLPSQPNSSLTTFSLCFYFLVHLFICCPLKDTSF